jgi:O-antigen/teichoic acid export membrane protein
LNFAFRRSIGKPGWAILDQGLFALANFVLNVLLARWLSSNEYGMFTIAYTTLLLVATFHTALLTEPMLVFGSGKYSNQLSYYFGVVSLAHWLGTGLFTILSLGIGLFFWNVGRLFEAQTVWALALSSPFILFLWLVRRACYVRMSPHLAGYAGMMYLLVIVISILLLFQSEMLTGPIALLVLGTASLTSGTWLVIRLRIKLPPLEREGLVADVGRDHWNYGRWSIMTGVLMWIPGQIIYFLLPIWVGLDQCAGLRALVNLIMPYVLVCTALGTILTPSLVRAQGKPHFWILTFKYLFFLVGGGVLYWLGIGLASLTLIRWLYNGLYIEYADFLWILGGLPIFSAIIGVFGAVLRSLQQPALIFWSHVSSSIFALTIGLGLVAKWGISGAVFAMMITYAISAAVMVALYFRFSSGREGVARQCFTRWQEQLK